MPGKFDEDAILQLLYDRFHQTSPVIRLGIGDDAAVVRTAGRDWAITTDMLLEEIDFRRKWITPAQLGHKSLAVNLSDLAAMGARPRFYLVALGLPSGIDRKWILRFYAGMTRLGSRFGAVLAGGDLSASISGIQITITACGDLPPGTAVLRSGGKPGDLLLVTGCLGRSAAGLRLLEEGDAGRKTLAGREAIRCHLMPEPQCELGCRLAETRLARCMMDLSDGLSSDLPRLCRASGTGAEIYASSLPTFSPARRWGLDPLLLALHGGEDFELLFSIPRRRLRMFEKTCPAAFRRARIIGRLTKGGGVRWAPEPGGTLRPLAPLGWDHFRSRT